jgi:hypothetical protein
MVVAALAVTGLTAACTTPNPAAQPLSGPDTSLADTASNTWALDGNGTAERGSTDLTFHGTYSLGDDATVFDGGTGYADTEEPGPIDTTSSFTVAAWVGLYPPRMLGGAVYADAVSQLGSISTAFNLGVAEGAWAFSMRAADTNEYGQAIRAKGGSASPADDTWVHLVGMQDKEAGLLRLYVDGQPAGSAAFAEPWQAQGPLTIGRSQFGAPSGFWPGAIADVRVFPTTLTDQQVSELADQTRPTSTPPPAPDTTSELSVINGTYEYQYTPSESENLAELLGPEAEAAGLPGDATVVLRFADGLWQQYYAIDGEDYMVGGQPEGDGGNYTIDGDTLALSNLMGTANYQWALNQDTLTLDLKDTPPDADVARFVMDHEYTRTAK